MKSKDPLFINKLLSALLIGGLVLMSSKYLVNIVYHPSLPAESAYNIKILEPTASGAKEEVKLLPIAERLNLIVNDSGASPKLGASLFKKCQSCHTINKGGKNKVGPNIWNIVGVAAGEKKGFAYSANLPKVGEWSFENLDAYLTKPSAFVKGTKMSFSGLKNPYHRASVILYLRSFSDNPVPIPLVEPSAE